MADGFSRMYHSGRSRSGRQSRKDTQSRAYLSGGCCNTKPETHDVDDDDEDEDDEGLDELGQRNQKKRKRCTEDKMKRTRGKKRVVRGSTTVGTVRQMFPPSQCPQGAFKVTHQIKWLEELERKA